MRPLLSPRALGALLGLAEQTVYNRHSTRGDLPPVLKLGRLLRFRPEDVDAWILNKLNVARPAPPPIASRRPGRPSKVEQRDSRTARARAVDDCKC